MRRVRPSCGIAKAVSRIVTVERAVDTRGAGAPGTRHAATEPVYVAAPAAGTTKARLGASPPDAVSSTASQEPRVSLNSAGPRTVAGSVMTQLPSAPRVSRWSGSPGFQPLKVPATWIAASDGVLAGTLVSLIVRPSAGGAADCTLERAQPATAVATATNASSIAAAGLFPSGRTIMTPPGDAER